MRFDAKLVPDPVSTGWRMLLSDNLTERYYCTPAYALSQWTPPVIRAIIADVLARFRKLS